MVDINDSDVVDRELMNMLRSRTPSGQSATFCYGCYKPTNSLTVRHHIGLVWDKNEIVNDGNKRYIRLKCKFCDEYRQLSMSSFSMKQFLANWNDNDIFVLQKDHAKCNETNVYVFDGCYNFMSAFNSMLKADNDIIKQLTKIGDNFLKLRKKEFEELKN